ncbi:MAG TPA: DUF4350 domain-containing protein [Thermoanaerobaculia bacterium]|nr:DUF4350 domain-containing protein [Thermoanaerobaculia bacterium]
MLRHFCPLSVIAISIAFLAAPILQAQENDATFDTSVTCPAYAAGVGPRLLIDEAHRNLHTVQGRYASFAQVARNDGYRVESWTKAFVTGELPEKAILVIANAQGEEKPTDPAFQPDEILALRQWVESGGSLFLIADHAPFGTAAQTLAEAFGIRMIDGHVRDVQHQATGLPGPFFLEFTQASGLLGDHAILRGRSQSEQIRRVVTFAGQALSATPPAVVLLRLGDKAESVANPNGADSTVQPVGGSAQAVAVEIGKGRVVVAGEAGLFGAQIIRGEAARRAGLQETLRFGMNHPGTDDRQLLLNVLHWLSGLL